MRVGDDVMVGVGGEGDTFLPGVRALVLKIDIVIFLLISNALAAVSI